MNSIEDFIEKSANYTKNALSEKKGKHAIEKYKYIFYFLCLHFVDFFFFKRFMGIDEDELMMQEIDQIYKSSPSYIKNGTMKDYQIEGLNWLISLHNRNINGILADEMGLGKTLQTISLLGHLKNELKIKEPHLVIVPKSTVYNWEREIKNFCPSLSTLVLMGNKDERKSIVSDNLKKFSHDVLITSYDIALLEKYAIKKISWYYVVIDEAHRIKNSEARLSAYVRELKTKHRMLITGTPLQNNLQELWSLLNFLLPNIFNSNKEFIEIFDEKAILGIDQTTDETSKIENETAEETTKEPETSNAISKPTELVNKLRAIIKPLFLRRLKSEAEKSIPPKNEIYLYADLTKMQRDLYKILLLKNISMLKNVTNNARAGVGKLHNIIVQTRKCCSHPYLFDGVEEGPPYVTDSHIVNASGKMIVLDKLLDRLRADGHRCLLFCQFIETLNILEDYLMWKGLKYFRLDGSTDLDDRQQMINAFNDPSNHEEYFIFMISTRAGGLGINLQTADTVIFYDSDWNPQVDLQAMDRAHRIGQLKPVNVYRLITACTVEERILSRASYKLNLDRNIIQRKRDDGTDDPLILSKDDAIATLNRGLDFILRSESNKQSTDEQKQIDIDTLIEKSKKIRDGNEKELVLTKETIELNKQAFKQNLVKLGAMENYTVYEFEGENFRVIQAKHLNEQMIANQKVKSKLRSVRPQKEIVLEKYRFYPMKLPYLLEREAYAYKKLINYEPKFEECDDSALAFRRYNAEREKIRNALPLSRSEEEEKNRMLKMGFQNWSKGEYNLVIQAMRLYGRYNYSSISKYIQTKTPEEVEEYLKVLWERVNELSNASSIIQSIEKTEASIRRKNELHQLLHKAFKNVENPITDIKIDYSLMRHDLNSFFNEEEDKILLWLYYKYQSFYLSAEEKTENTISEKKLFQRIRNEIRYIPTFRFNWYFMSCDANMLNNRCKYLLKLFQLARNSTVSNLKASRTPLVDTSIINYIALDEDDTGIYNINNNNSSFHHEISQLDDDENESTINEAMDVDYLESDNDNISSVSSESLESPSTSSKYRKKQIPQKHQPKTKMPQVTQPKPFVVYYGNMDDDDSLPAI